MDCSTIDITVSKSIAKLCNDKKAIFVDAPVSGGVSSFDWSLLLVYPVFFCFF